MNFSFPKNEKVVSLKVINALFSKQAHSIFVHPFKISVIINTEPPNPPCQVLVIVPKRNFKKAVDRNRIKRQIREIYRLNKEILTNKLSANEQSIAISVSFVGKTTLEYNTGNQAIIKVIHSIIQFLEKNYSPSVHPVN